MCLLLDKEKTSKFKNKKTESPWMYVYKEVCVSYDPSHNPIRKNVKVFSPVQDVTIHGGWYKSDRKTEELTEEEKLTERIYHGIHAHIKNNLMLTDFHVNLRCKALRKDVVAIGYFDEIVCTKIFIPKSEIEKAKSKLLEIYQKR